MALLFNDDKEYIVCKCGNKTFTEEKVFTYKNSEDRRGKIIKKTLIGIQPKCTKCGILHNTRLDKEIVEEGK